MSADANQERKKGQHYTTTDDNLLVLREYGAHVLYVRTCVQNKHTHAHSPIPLFCASPRRFNNFLCVHIEENLASLAEQIIIIYCYTIF